MKRTVTKFVIDPEFSLTNLSRARRWHPGGIEEWSINDWLVACGGELGEAMNVAKKLRRVEDAIENRSEDPDRLIDSVQKGRDALGEELADTFIYLELVAQRAGIDLSAVIVAKFNATSEKYGFPERL